MKPDTDTAHEARKSTRRLSIRPLKGWRAFAGEVGVVVLGVLLALGAGQLADDWQWRSRVKDARAVLGNDLYWAMFMAQERELYSRCIGRRLRDVAAILDQAQRTGRLPPVGQLGNPSVREYRLPGWESLSATGITGHFPHDEVAALSNLATQGGMLAEISPAEMADWARLYAIVGPGRSIGEAELGSLRATLSSAGYHAKLMRLGTYQLTLRIRDIHVPHDPELLRDRDAEWAKTSARVAALPICRPLGPAPIAYGASPLDYELEGPIER